jgi:hypothetical protein
MAVTHATLIYGDSGSGKSSLLATLAEWGWEKHKKISLLYTTDSGGFPSKMDALVRAGIVRVWKMRTRGEAFETCSKACQGYWPVEFSDPLAGETLPGVKLRPCILTKYTLYCNKCKTAVKTSVDRQSFQQVFTCPKCSNRVNLTVGFVEEESEVPTFFKEVGLVMYDGLTSMNDWIMEDMADKTARGILKGETAMGKIISGDEVYGGSTRNHYGFAQVRSGAWLRDATNLPNLIVGPIFTALKQRATDDYNVKIYGPEIAGKAKTANVPTWVGNSVCTSTIVNAKGQKEWRLYLTEYKEPDDDTNHLCKTRSAPGLLPDYLSDGPVDTKTGKPADGTEPFTEFNLGHFMDLAEAATQKTLEQTMNKFPDAPGLDYIKDMEKEVEVAPKEEPKEVKPTIRPKPAQVVKPKPAVPRPAPAKAAKPKLNRPAVPRPGKK